MVQVEHVVVWLVGVEEEGNLVIGSCGQSHHYSNGLHGLSFLSILNYWVAVKGY